MAKKKYKFSIKGRPFYPHIKLTRERFPRILITRIIAADDAEYFGAFLNRSNARILVDFLNRTFKLRSCEIEIDGGFNYPCTMFYKRRCLAPCVADLIDQDAYDEVVSLLRLFLLNDRGLFRTVIVMKIEAASEKLDFEAAAKWRDILTAVEDYWADTRHAVWLDGTSDTFQYRESDGGLDVFLISQKGRRVLGERVFAFAGASELEAADAIADVIEQFYKVHAPKEIRVGKDFHKRHEIQRTISKKFGRKVPIVLLNENNRKISTELAVYGSSAELDVRRSIISTSPRELTNELKRIFSLKRVPKRISAVDVSHISGTDQVAATVAWENGKSLPNAAEYWLSDEAGEIRTLADFVKRRWTNQGSDKPELLLVDGGRSQLNAAVAVVQSPNIFVISAVKPPGEHSEVSHFLTAGGAKIAFDAESDAHRLLQRLRDEAHEFANAVHRNTRDFSNYYALASVLPSLTESERQNLLMAFGSHSKVAEADAHDLEAELGNVRAKIAENDIENFRTGKNVVIKPLVVPVRFQEENGGADDLRPIGRAPRKVSRRFR